MSGHSQFKNIMNRKGAQDKARARVFSKCAREITVAVKTGGADPNSNPRLRLAIQNARSENMPKDNIERAISKGSQSADTTNYEEVRYEGYGPGRVAIIVEALTDNRARTAPNLRALFTKRGGSFGDTVLFNFEKIGYIEYALDVASADAMFEAALDAGADDVQTTETAHEIICKPEDLGAVREALEAKFATPNVARLDWKPTVETPVTDLETAQKLMSFIEELNEDDDVQRVITNANIAEDILAQL